MSWSDFSYVLCKILLRLVEIMTNLCEHSEGNMPSVFITVRN